MPRRRITLRQLETFAEVARSMSFSVAAEKLHLTQPAVSIQIKHIAEAVGLPLFEQSGREIALTAAGQELLATVRELDDVWNRFEAAIADLKGFKRGKLRVIEGREPVAADLPGHSPSFPGLWQVNGRNTIADFDRWMELDLQYIDNWSPTLDLKILLRTIPAVLSGKSMWCRFSTLSTPGPARMSQPTNSWPVNSGRRSVSWPEFSTW